VPFIIPTRLSPPKKINMRKERHHDEIFVFSWKEVNPCVQCLSLGGGEGLRFLGSTLVARTIRWKLTVHCILIVFRNDLRNASGNQSELLLHMHNLIRQKMSIALFAEVHLSGA